jgi:hypothetical protein
MKPIDHSQARRWIQARLDGALSQADAARLETHLLACAGCRRYAAQVDGLDAALRRQLGPASTLLLKGTQMGPSPSATIHTIDSRLRAKMKTQRISNFTNTILFTGLLVILVAGLVVILSTLRMPGPLQSGGKLEPQKTQPVVAPPARTPAPGATTEWTVTHPLTSTAQILAELDGLAGKTARLAAASAWLHTRRLDQGVQGNLETSFIESWTALAADGACREQFILVKDQPDGETVYQTLVSLADGASGDLVALRAGAGEVAHAAPGAAVCTLEGDAAFASSLRRRMAGQAQGKGSEIPDGARAWRDELDGRPVFVVEAAFLHDPDAPYARSVETVSFDLEHGLALRWQVRMQMKNETQIGKMLTGFETEFLQSLPADAAQQIDQWTAELRAFENPSQTPQPPAPAPAEKQPAAMAAPSAATAAQLAATAAQSAALLDNLPYTQDNPLQDGAELAGLLAGLRQRYLDGLSRPGWYGFTTGSTGGSDALHGPHSLTHVLDASGRCETMNYYTQDGVTLPQEIHLADGAWGLISSVVDGDFTEGAPAGAPEAAPCRVDTLFSFTLLDNAIANYLDLIQGRVPGDYRAWAEVVDGQRVLRLYSDRSYTPPRPSLMHPVTGKFALIDRTERWTDFDPQTGAWLAEWERFYLSSGEVLDGEKLSAAEYATFEQPPAELRGAFDEAVERMNAYLEGLKP